MVATQVAINDRPSALRYPRGEGRRRRRSEVGIPLEVGARAASSPGGKKEVALLSSAQGLPSARTAADDSPPGLPRRSPTRAS